MESGSIGEVIQIPEGPKNVRQITKTPIGTLMKCKYNRHAEVRIGILEAVKFVLCCIVSLQNVVLLYDLRTKTQSHVDLPVRQSYR